MTELLLLAAALSMDAFAVSIGLGAKVPCGSLACNRRALALKAGIFFGAFQGLMPLFGYMAGVGLFASFGALAHWLAGGVLLAVGTKMIYEGFLERIEETITRVSTRVLMLLAIATSLDAGAAGLSLHLMDPDPFVSMALIALVTCLASNAGVHIGARGGEWLEGKAEIAGGVVLLLIAAKIMLEPFTLPL